MSRETTKGKLLSPLELEVLGAIDVNDLVDRAAAPLPSSEAPSLAKLRQIHHEIARLLASVCPKQTWQLAPATALAESQSSSRTRASKSFWPTTQLALRRSS